MPVRRPVCLICFIFLFVILIATKGRKPDPSWDVDAANGVTVSVVGKIVDRQEKNGNLQIFLKDISVKTDRTYFPDRSNGIVVKPADGNIASDNLRLGSRVEARGIFVPFELPRNEGMFDARSYYLIRGYDGQLKRARIVGVSKGYDHVSETLRGVRDRAFEIFRANMSENDAALAAAMTLGDRTGLEAEIKELYQRVGISHVLALSGLHIASVGLALLHFLKKCGVSSAISSVAAFAAIAAYAVMTGLGTSTSRAMIMFGIFALSALCGRTYDLLSAASLSAVIILVFDPYYIYDTGFLLSFGAILGIACIFPVLDSIPDTVMGFLSGGDISPDELSGTENHTVRSTDTNRGWMRKLYQSVCISVSVMLATLPVMAHSFMQISVFSVIINLEVIPLMGLVLLTAFSALIIGFTGTDPGLILKITHYILSFFEISGRIFEKIPGNLAIIGEPRKWQIITYAIITISSIITWNIGFGDFDLITQKDKSVDRSSRRISDNSEGYSKKSQNKITYIIETSSERRSSRRKKFAISTITLVMLIASAVILSIHPREKLEIKNIDVGQGDCALVYGKGLPVMMIDGGSSDIRQVAKYRIVPVLKANRLPVIDYCFLTHMDSDHVNGVIEILEDEVSGIRIKTVIVSSAADQSSENYVRLCRAASGRNVRIVSMSAGDSICFGDTGSTGLNIICINPVSNTGRTVPVSESDANDSSIVLAIRYDKFTALFTGDIGEEVEREILNEVPDCTYLKVAHHGSRYSSSEVFLKKASPEISVISAGVDNSYGHPHKEAMERLMRSGNRIYCTKDCGQIMLTLNGDSVSVDTML